MKLWLVRANPEGQSRINEFLAENIIAIGWKQVPSMVGRTKEQIKDTLLHHTTYGTGDINLKLGMLNHFANNMAVGDLCVVPDGDTIYVAKIAGDYTYVPDKVTSGYPHQRKVIWLETQIQRDNLPEALRKSLRTQVTVANFSHHLNVFTAFLGQSEDAPPAMLDTSVLFNGLSSLLPQAIENIKKEISSEDPNRRFNASLAVIQLLKDF